MADELVEQMEEMNIQNPSLFGIPTDALQHIFNYLRVEQKELAESAVKQSPEYDRFMRTPVPLPPNRMITQTERLEIIEEAERQFIASSPVNIPYQIALRYFRDLARRRGHNIN
jgi:hypothetical protein